MKERTIRHWLSAIGTLLLLAPPAYPAATVTLAKRIFAPHSPAATFQTFFSDARRAAASTTPAWQSTDTDLSAWGPALIFPLLEHDASTDVTLDLAAPLESEGTASALMFRTVGLYAAKSRLPFTETPSLMAATDRNLRTIEHATRDWDAFIGGADLGDWGSIGAGAWIAYLELLYQDYFDLGKPGRSRWSADGLRIVDQLLVRGRLKDGGFRRDPRDVELALWPTVLMIYALVAAYESAEDIKYESAALAAAAAIEALHADDGGYSSTPAQAAPDARANTYLAGALLLLSKDTGDTQYRERAVALLRWLTSGPGAAMVRREVSLNAHVAYLVLLLDSLATAPSENLLGRRPMRAASEPGTPSAQTVSGMAGRLLPAGFRYRGLFNAVLHTLLQRTPFAAGDFAYDHGDSPGYAAAVLLQAGDTMLAPQILEREERLIAWPRRCDFTEISFGAGALFAAVEHPNVADTPAAARALRHYLFLSGAFSFFDRYYLDGLDWLTSDGSCDYGPTVIAAQIAATHLEYAAWSHGPPVGWVLRPSRVGQALLDAAGDMTWQADTHTYRTRPDSETTALLPNAMMIIALLDAYSATGEAAYVARARETAAGLDVLWDGAHGAYYASTAQMGDDMYESLSTNSYAALALLRLSAATQTSQYRDRARQVFDFISRDLYGDGIVYQHLYRGRRATGDVWCSGCNWRVLAELLELAKMEGK